MRISAWRLRGWLQGVGGERVGAMIVLSFRDTRLRWTPNPPTILRIFGFARHCRARPGNPSPSKNSCEH
jgi:hypothetical protein